MATDRFCKIHCMKAEQSQLKYSVAVKESIQQSKPCTYPLNKQMDERGMTSHNVLLIFHSSCS